jgi:hypothetical protein
VSGSVEKLKIRAMCVSDMIVSRVAFVSECVRDGYHCRTPAGHSVSRMKPHAA